MTTIRQWTHYAGKGFLFLFHPLWLPSYLFFCLWYILQQPHTLLLPHSMQMRAFSYFWSSAFFPLFSIFILWRLKLGVNSFIIYNQKERIIPYFLVMFFYWWCFYLSKNLTEQPPLLLPYYFGLFITTPFAIIANNYIKPSWFILAWSNMVAVLIIACIKYHFYPIWIISIAVLICIILYNMHRYVYVHTKKEYIYSIIIALVCQLISFYFWV